jgi:hypothetical protein
VSARPDYVNLLRSLKPHPDELTGKVWIKPETARAIASELQANYADIDAIKAERDAALNDEHYSEIIDQQEAQIERLTAELSQLKSAATAVLHKQHRIADNEASDAVQMLRDVLAPTDTPPPAPAAPVGDDTHTVAYRLELAENGVQNALGHMHFVTDNRAACAIEYHNYALHNIIEAIKKMQKGETQS